MLAVAFFLLWFVLRTVLVGVSMFAMFLWRLMMSLDLLLVMWQLRYRCLRLGQETFELILMPLSQV